MSVYLDYNASAPINSEVLGYMIDVYTNAIGNADSRTHDFGDAAKSIVEKARNSVASILGIQPSEVFFTSGATESDNLALQGLRGYALQTGKTHIITTAIEHKAVLETARALSTEGFEVDYVKPNSTGRIDEREIIRKIRPNTLLVSMMHANNETGVIQPVLEVGEYISNTDVLFHVDATQTFGKLVDELKVLKYDMLSMSAHKIGGPQGVGTLVLRKKEYRLPPVKNIMYGGQQERGLRPGTVPVALVAGLGKACDLAEKNYKEVNRKCELIKKTILETIDSSGLNYEINGDLEYLMSNTLNLYIKRVSSEALMLSTREYCGISNGSACNSHSYEPSYVLKAMNFSEERMDSSIRISWGYNTDLDECINSITMLTAIAKELAY